MAMEDSNIIRLYESRDEEAIRATAEKYGRYLASISGNILSSREDVEECLNDAYLRVWESVPPEKPRFLRAYLATIVRNLSFHRYEHERAMKRGNGEIPAVLDELSEILTDGSRPEDQLTREELLSAVNDFLETLPKDKRILFVRRYFYADGVKDLAACYGMSENRLSVTLSRLRMKLRESLYERGLIE